MLQLFKKAPTPLTPWADASKYREAGYYTLPIEHHAIESRYGSGEEPLGGGWAHGLGEPTHPERATVGILCGCLPLGNVIGLDDCRATWIAAVRIDVHSNGRVARDLEAVVRRYAGDDAPVRECRDSAHQLLPMRVADDPRMYGQTTPYFILAGDKRYSGSNSVRVDCVGKCFVAGGGEWYWRDDRDLLAVPRAQLALLTPEKAREMIAACESILNTKKAA